jgi:hypothetical protein
VTKPPRPRQLGGEPPARHVGARDDVAEVEVLRLERPPAGQRLIAEHDHVPVDILKAQATGRHAGRRVDDRDLHALQMPLPFRQRSGLHGEGHVVQPLGRSLGEDDLVLVAAVAADRQDVPRLGDAQAEVRVELLADLKRRNLNAAVEQSAHAHGWVLSGCGMSSETRPTFCPSSR